MMGFLLRDSPGIYGEKSIFRVSEWEVGAFLSLLLTLRVCPTDRRRPKKAQSRPYVIFIYNSPNSSQDFEDSVTANIDCEAKVIIDN